MSAWLFSYGSNHTAQLAARIGRPVTDGQRASLKGYQRVFRGWSDRWGGGVASLEPKRGAVTYGWAAKVSAQDLARLDVHEGVASGHYARSVVKITLGSGKAVSAVAYVALAREHSAPSQAYLEACARTVGEWWSEGGRPITAADFPIRNNGRRPRRAKQVKLTKPKLDLVPLKDVDYGGYSELLHDFLSYMGYSERQVDAIFQTPMPVRSCPVPGGILSQARHEYWRGAPASGGAWWDYRDDEFMEDMQRSIAAGERLPPIVLQHGALVDGYHRTLAHAALGLHEIDCVKLEEWVASAGVGAPELPPNKHTSQERFLPNPQRPGAAMSRRWNNPPERDLRLLREELDDAIFFKRPAPQIQALQARVAQLETALAQAAVPPPEGPIQRRERLEQEAFRHAQGIERLNAQAAALARQIEAREQDLRESVRMRDPAREIEAQRGAVAALQAGHAAIMIDLDVAQRNLAAMVERAKAELGPHGPAPMAPKNAKAEADRQRAAVALRQAQVRLSSLQSEVDDPATGRDFERLNLVRREIRETQEEIATLEARVRQNPPASGVFFDYVSKADARQLASWWNAHNASHRYAGRKRPHGRFWQVWRDEIASRPRRNPVDDDALRRLEREAAQSPHDQALQDRLEHERTRRDPGGAMTVEYWRSQLLHDLEAFSITLHMPGPNWRLLARLGGVLSEFAGLSVDSAQRRFSDFYRQFGREALFLASTERLKSEVGLAGVARAIADASRPQIRRYTVVRDAVLAEEIADDERIAQTLASKESLLPRPRPRHRGLNPPWSPEELERMQRELEAEGVSRGHAQTILRGEIAPPPPWPASRPVGRVTPLRQIHEGRMSPELRQVWPWPSAPALRQESEGPRRRHDEKEGPLATNPRRPRRRR